jgi:hypothetical protein
MICIHCIGLGVMCNVPIGLGSIRSGSASLNWFLYAKSEKLPKELNLFLGNDFIK